MPSDKLIFCDDCRWNIVGASGQHYARCGHRKGEKSETEVLSPQELACRDDYEERAKYWYCSTMRMKSSECGPDARLFEPKVPGDMQPIPADAAEIARELEQDLR